MVDIKFGNRAEILRKLSTMSSEQLEQVYSVFHVDSEIMKHVAVHPALDSQKILNLATTAGRKIRSQAFRNPTLQKQTDLWHKIIDNNLTHQNLMLNLLDYEDLPADALLYAHQKTQPSFMKDRNRVPVWGRPGKEWVEKVRRRICAHPNFPMDYIKERLLLIEKYQLPEGMSKIRLPRDISSEMRAEQYQEASYFLANRNITSNNVHTIVRHNLRLGSHNGTISRVIELCNENPATEDRSYFYFIDQSRGNLLIDFDVDMSVEVLEYLLLWFQTTSNYKQYYAWDKRNIDYAQETLNRLHQKHPDYKYYPVEWVEAIYEV